MRRILLAVIFLMISGCAPAPASQSIVPLDPGFKLEGRSTADLSADWWKWSMSSSAEINPVSDISGVHCDSGQQGNVWFLAGSFGSSKVKRNCFIPTGKYVFFPVINVAYWPKGNNGYTCQQAKAAAAAINEKALDLFVTLDGVAVTEIQKYRVATEQCFNVLERAPASLNPYNAYPSASDGYWILLSPLKNGKHTIKFGGRYGGDIDMTQDIEYELFVQ